MSTTRNSGLSSVGGGAGVSSVLMETKREDKAVITPKRITLSAARMEFIDLMSSVNQAWARLFLTYLNDLASSTKL